jgi:hypothetical protein
MQCMKYGLQEEQVETKFRKNRKGVVGYDEHEGGHRPPVKDEYFVFFTFVPFALEPSSASCLGPASWLLLTAVDL